MKAIKNLLLWFEHMMKKLMKLFIFNVKILLAEKAFGKQLNENIIEYIAKHEFGHALGIGHANFKESLMSALVYNSFNKITDCEREAVKEANDWKLIDIICG